MFHWSMTWRDPTYPLQGASENWMPRFCKVFTKLPRTSVTWLEIVEMCLEMLSLQPGSHCNHHHARSHIAFPLKHDHCFSYLLSSTCCTAGSAGDWRVVDESGHHKLLWTELSKVREEKITGSSISLKFKLKRHEQKTLSHSVSLLFV